MTEKKDVLILEHGSSKETVESEVVKDGEPIKYFQEYLRRADMEFEMYGKVGGDMPNFIGKETQDLLAERVKNGDGFFVNDDSFMTMWETIGGKIDKDLVVRKILSRDRDEVIDSELARSFFNDEIEELEEERLGLIEENNEIEGDPEVEANQELFLEIGALVEKTNQRIDSIRGQEGAPDEEALKSLERVLLHLRGAQAENPYDKANRAIEKNYERIGNIADKSAKYSELRDNVEISGKEARGIEEVKLRLTEMPNIKFNEEFGQLLAKKRKEYEARVGEKRKGVFGFDDRLKFEILSRLFQGEEVSAQNLAEEMNIKTLRDYKGIERAAKVIQDYTESGGQNVAKQ